MTRTALITGITGQDGSYLAEYLLAQGYRVFGVTRNPVPEYSENIRHLENKIELIHSTYELSSLISILRRTGPDEVYNLAGQSFVSKSWELISQTIESAGIIPCNILEAITQTDRGIRFFQASSSEIFLPTGHEILSETTPLSPYNPYGCSKALAHNMVFSYRRNYGLFAVCGILFNHESPRRGRSFASMKIVNGAVRIKMGLQEKLVLGNVDIVRDWGYAPEYVRAMHLMLRQSDPKDLLICSGEGRSVGEIAQIVFELLGLAPEKCIQIDERLFRPGEPNYMVGSNAQIRRELGWRPEKAFSDVLKEMVELELKRLRSELN